MCSLSRIDALHSSAVRWLPALCTPHWMAWTAWSNSLYYNPHCCLIVLRAPLVCRSLVAVRQWRISPAAEVLRRSCEMSMLVCAKDCTHECHMCHLLLARSSIVGIAQHLLPILKQFWQGTLRLHEPWAALATREIPDWTKADY